MPIIVGKYTIFLEAKATTHSQLTYTQNAHRFLFSNYKKSNTLIHMTKALTIVLKQKKIIIFFSFICLFSVFIFSIYYDYCYSSSFVLYSYTYSVLAQYAVYRYCNILISYKCVCVYMCICGVVELALGRS